MKSEVECRNKIIRVMEDFLSYLANGVINNINLINLLKAELSSCGSLADPYIAVIEGNDPGNTLSAAISYYQYVRYVRGELTIDKTYIHKLDLELSDPAKTYSVIIDEILRALRIGDYVSASFLVDLAFVVRSYMLCIGNFGSGDYCERIRRSYRARLLILRGRDQQLSSGLNL